MSTAHSDVRIVLVDDQPLVREGIATILGARPGIAVVGQAGDGAEALEVVAATRPDVVCMDVEMPGMDGLEATRRIVTDDGAPKVLVLTTFNREDYLLDALRAGASAFLLKTARPEHLADAIHSVAAGDALLSPEVTRAIIERAVVRGQLEPGSPAPPAVRTSPAPAVGNELGAAGPDLTERETEILRLVATGMSNDEIAAHLVIGRATVKTHVSNVLMKLQLRDRVQAVVYAYRHGLVGTG